ncbi:hypothetical protein ASD91_18895 [Pseudomonas sp. Root68]|nr:hypothetical protein ASD91_18895 [Pseudomonas sp. Root68]KRB64462.1 hypothetical protein ASD95_16165 [Pseudomonas sp. Root71]
MNRQVADNTVSAHPVVTNVIEGFAYPATPAPVRAPTGGNSNIALQGRWTRPSVQSGLDIHQISSTHVLDKGLKNRRNIFFYISVIIQIIWIDVQRVGQSNFI